MNVTDLVIIAVVVVSGLLAFSRGFVRSVLWLASLIGAVLVAMYGYGYAAPYARDWIGARWLADLATLAVLFVVSLFLFTLITHFISRGVRESAIGAVDRSLGFVFGLARGLLLICLVYLLALWAAPVGDWPDWMRQARTLPLVRASTLASCAVIPKRFGNQCRDVIARGHPDPNANRNPVKEFERIIQPKTKAAPEGRSGYNPGERKEMDRLFESTQ